MDCRSRNMRTRKESQAHKELKDDLRNFYISAKGSQRDKEIAAAALNKSMLNIVQGRLRRQHSANPEYDAEEVAQNFNANVLDGRLKNFNPDCEFSFYGLGMVSNGCWDVGRKSRRHKAEVLPASCAAKDDEPSAQVIKQEQRGQVWKAVARLPRKMRQIMIAKYWLGMRSKQIADRLDIRVAAVNRLAFLARRRLRKVL